MNGRLKTILIQCTVVAFVLIVRLLIQRFAPWHGDLWTWANRGLPRFGGPLAVAALVVLFFFLLHLLWTLYIPWNPRKTEDVMGRGCFHFILWIATGAFVLLIVAIVFKIHWAIRLIAGTTLGLSAIAVGWLVVDAIEAQITKRR